MSHWAKSDPIWMPNVTSVNNAIGSVALILQFPCTSRSRLQYFINAYLSLLLLYFPFLYYRIMFGSMCECVVSLEISNFGIWFLVWLSEKHSFLILCNVFFFAELLIFFLSITMFSNRYSLSSAGCLYVGLMSYFDCSQTF